MTDFSDLLLSGDLPAEPEPVEPPEDSVVQELTPEEIQARNEAMYGGPDTLVEQYDEDSAEEGDDGSVNVEQQQRLLAIDMARGLNGLTSAEQLITAAEAIREYLIDGTVPSA